LLLQLLPFWKHPFAGFCYFYPSIAADIGPIHLAAKHLKASSTPCCNPAFASFLLAAAKCSCLKPTHTKDTCSSHCIFTNMTKTGVSDRPELLFK
jgi:hypothetical protein